MRVQRTRFYSDERGLAFVEFAMVLPFMVMLFLGGVEFLQGIAIKRQVILTSNTLASVVSQYTTISSSNQMPDVLNASVQVMAPYSSANTQATVSFISIDNAGRATVTWSRSLNGTPRAAGSVVTLPAALDIPNSGIILAEASYSYTPLFDFMHVGTVNLASSVYMDPRDSPAVTLIP